MSEQEIENHENESNQNKIVEKKERKVTLRTKHTKAESNHVCEKEKYYCFDCKHEFGNKSKLEDHMKSIYHCEKTGEEITRDYKCEFCELSFILKEHKQKHELKIHLTQVLERREKNKYPNIVFDDQKIQEINDFIKLSIQEKRTNSFTDPYIKDYQERLID